MRNAAHDELAASGYRLVDFGEGRKLESFAGRLIDRPSPAAQGWPKHRQELWRDADSVFHAVRRDWRHRTEWPPDLRVEFDGLAMPVSPTPFGHVGIFPEQLPNWRWLIETAPERLSTGTQKSNDSVADGAKVPSALNLFAYTGASSIAMATSGMKVAHVDAAKQNVTTARAAAALNGLQDHPIRYLVDDAGKFTAREIRRGNRYHTIVLDPPAYGHSPAGKAWRLERDLWPLIDACLSILTPDNFRLLITGHSPQVGPMDVVNYLRPRLERSLGLPADRFDAGVQSGRLKLSDSADRTLDAGFFVRCS